jgi:phytoene dehydrogenase-like protein
VLRELQVAWTGAAPRVGGYALARGRLHELPGTPLALLRTSLLSPGAKLEVARHLGTLSRIDCASIVHLTMREWLDREIRHTSVRDLFASLIRVSTYTNGPEQQSAGAAIAQVRHALRPGVRYLDGGWQTLVDGLHAIAETAGVRLLLNAKVTSLQQQDRAWSIGLASGAVYRATTVIIAAGLSDAADLLQDTPTATTVRGWAADAIPATAACLDVALHRLPRPGATFALGIDRPLYLSVHSAVAKLAPAGGALIHVARYQPVSQPSDPQANAQELEALLDLVQPGWRDQVVYRRFLPHMVVIEAIARAAQGGLAGRPGPAVPGCDNLYVAGDWVGPEGMLADAALASARQAAHLVLASKGEVRRHSLPGATLAGVAL